MILGAGQPSGTYFDEPPFTIREPPKSSLTSRTPPEPGLTKAFGHTANDEALAKSIEDPVYEHSMRRKIVGEPVGYAGVVLAQR